MLIKYKVTEAEQSEGKEQYFCIFYNTDKNTLTFGGRIRNMQYILRNVQELFYIEDVHIPEPEYNQRINIRWVVPEYSNDLFNQVMLVLKGNYYFKLTEIYKLNRLM